MTIQEGHAPVLKGPLEFASVQTLGSGPAVEALTSAPAVLVEVVSQHSDIPLAEPHLSTIAVHTAHSSRRGANPSRDNIWTRHHARCAMGVIRDLQLGGFDAAREVANQTRVNRQSEVARILRATHPWLVNAIYLNFVGSATLAKHGLDLTFDRWVYNRVYYFDYDVERSEHPHNAKRGNLRAVYHDFYEVFSGEIEAGGVVSQDDAQAFWILVADRVPFFAPSVGVGTMAAMLPSETVSSTSGGPIIAAGPGQSND